MKSARMDIRAAWATPTFIRIGRGGIFGGLVQRDANMTDARGEYVRTQRADGEGLNRLCPSQHRQSGTGRKYARKGDTEYESRRKYAPKMHNEKPAFMKSA